MNRKRIAIKNSVKIVINRGNYVTSNRNPKVNWNRENVVQNISYEENKFFFNVKNCYVIFHLSVTEI